MKTRQGTVLEDRCLTFTRRNTRSETSKIGFKNSDPIPIDLIFEILLRLPSKSIARCRCVSKLWSSILVQPEFTELFLTKSSTRPKLLLIFKSDGELFFYSSPQPQNPIENSSPLVASYIMKIPINFYFERFSPINGFIILRDDKISEGNNQVTLICNPTTGQCLTVPKVSIGVPTYLGYDPIGKQYKLLSMTSTVHHDEVNLYEEAQVLTLGTGQLLWRKIECCVPHYPLHSGICIDGVLYYPACIDRAWPGTMVVCFDVRSEKFRLIKAPGNFCSAAYFGILINYNGKLAGLEAHGSRYVNERVTSIEMFVLEDVEKEEWSEHTYKISESKFRNAFGETHLRFAGVTRTNEIVLYDRSRTGHFFLFYYNMERNTVVKVEIQGMESLNKWNVGIFLDHVEDVDVQVLKMF